MTERDSRTADENGEKEFPSNTGIGLLLRKRREELGLSYEQISDMTRLRPRFLLCLENEEWEGLPSPAFVPGFIRTYARAVGIDEERAVGLYQETPTVELNPLKPLIIPGGKRKGKYLLVFLLLVAIACSYYFWKEYESSPGNVSKPPEKRVEDRSFGVKKPIEITKEEKLQPKDEVVEEKTSFAKGTNDEAPVMKPEQETIREETGSEPDETVQAEKAVTPSEDAEKEKEDQKLLLRANVKERTWVKIKIDGLEPKEFILLPGSRPEWRAKAGFELLIGNAGGLDFSLNGEEMKDLGNPGQVIRLKFPEDFERRSRDN